MYISKTNGIRKKKLRYEGKLKFGEFIGMYWCPAQVVIIRIRPEISPYKALKRLYSYSSLSKFNLISQIKGSNKDSISSPIKTHIIIS